MISAIILGAGQSTRMGQPKLLLPWGKVTILEQVISVFARAGVEDIVVITGGAQERIQEIILKCSEEYPARSVFNQAFEKGEMLSSIQCGLRVLADAATGAALIGLGDQPQVEERTVRSVHDTFLKMRGP